MHVIQINDCVNKDNFDQCALFVFVFEQKKKKYKKQLSFIAWIDNQIVGMHPTTFTAQ